MSLLKSMKNQLESIVGLQSIISNTGGRPVEMTASTGIIKSPGYVENIYPNNAACQWIIRAPPGVVRIIQ